MSDLIHILSVSLKDRYFMTTEGEVGEITNLFDQFGSETEDTELARAAVGFIPSGYWVSFRVSVADDSQRTPIH